MADAERSGRMDAAAHDREHVATGRSERDAALDQWQSRQGRGDENASSGVDDTDGERRNGESVRILERRSRQASAEAPRPGADSGFWDGAEFIPCLDGKSRRTQFGVSALVDGFPGRVGQLRAYGNAIVPQVAAEFVKAYLRFTTTTLRNQGVTETTHGFRVTGKEE
jgi:hypothetical protein